MGGALDRVFSKCWSASSVASAIHRCILQRCEPSELAWVGRLPARPPEPPACLLPQLSPEIRFSDGFCVCLHSLRPGKSFIFQEPDCLLPWSFNSQKFHHTQGSPGNRPFYPRGAFVKQAPGPGRGLGLENIWKFLILEIS